MALNRDKNVTVGFLYDLYMNKIKPYLNGVSGGANLSTLEDVSLSSPTDGQVLTYDNATSKWKNAASSGGASDLEDLTDVTITTPSNGQILAYDNTSSKWVNQNPSGGGASELDELDDIAITTPSDGDALVYDSTTSKWKNGTVSSVGDLDDLTDVDLTSPTDGQVLTYDNSASKWKNANVSGGHTIKNSSGTSVTQRDNLQFNTPFTVTDDSTNGKTIIAQSELASSDLDDFTEPSQASTGVTNISQMNDVTVSSASSGQLLRWNGSNWVNASENLTDLNNVSVSSPTTGDGLYYNGSNWTKGEPYHTYSTTEKAVGKWTDGKTIYEKSFVSSLPTPTAQGTLETNYVSIGALVDTIVSFNARFKSATNQFYPSPYLFPVASETVPAKAIAIMIVAANANDFTDTNYKNMLLIRTNRPAWGGYAAYITIQYTKV